MTDELKIFEGLYYRGEYPNEKFSDGTFASVIRTAEAMNIPQKRAQTLKRTLESRARQAKKIDVNTFIEATKTSDTKLLITLAKTLKLDLTDFYDLAGNIDIEKIKNSGKGNLLDSVKVSIKGDNTTTEVKKANNIQTIDKIIEIRERIIRNSEALSNDYSAFEFFSDNKEITDEEIINDLKNN